MLSREETSEILNGYNHGKISILTACSHSFLPMAFGARQEGIRIIGATLKDGGPDYHQAFPHGQADEYLKLNSYMDLIEDDKVVKYLQDNNVIAYGNGSLVQYMKGENDTITRFEDIPIPVLGNRKILKIEASRESQRQLLEKAGLNIPKVIHDPHKLSPDYPGILKLDGATGGRGFRIVQNHEEYIEAIEEQQVMYPGSVPTLQEYIRGVRMYPQYYYSPLVQEGCPAGEGTIELMGIDVRRETNIDEDYKAPQEQGKRTFVVVGNYETVIRESLLGEIMDSGRKVVDASMEYGGIIGAFGLEGVENDTPEFRPFEFTGRVMAGTTASANSGSIYSSMRWRPPRSFARKVGMSAQYLARWGTAFYWPKEMSTYRRMMFEVNLARKPLRKKKRMENFAKIIT